MNNKLDIKPCNADGQAHGLWEVYNSDGTPHYTSNYVNGKRQGVLEVYRTDGSVSFKINYINGRVVGYEEHSYGSKVFHLI